MMKHPQIASIVAVFLVLIIFLGVKLPHLGIRLSDSNIYFYNGYQILQGQILYKDIFFTNFPLVPYIASIYFFISHGNLVFYYLTAFFEVAIVAVFIFLINRQHAPSSVALLGATLYLFSFIVLATTDHQSGVFAASVFEVISLYFFMKKRYIGTGIFAALCVLTKAYFLPIVISYIFYFILKKRFHALFIFMISASITGLVVLLPTLLLAPRGLFEDVFAYSLTRSAGLSKSHILWFFITHDIFLFTILIFNITQFKKYLFFSLFSIFSILFILLYQDIYYLYLNLLIPVLCASFFIFWKTIHTKIKLQNMVLPTIIIIVLCINVYLYTTRYSSLQQLKNVDLLVSIIKNSPASSLYGTNDIAPALSYLSGTPLLDNITDTNSNLYRKKILDAQILTSRAIQKKSIIISQGAYYPQYNFHERVASEIFEKESVIASCKLIHSEPVVTENLINEINLFDCSQKM